MIIPPKSNTSSTNIADTFQGSQISIANDAKYLGVIFIISLTKIYHIVHI